MSSEKLGQGKALASWPAPSGPGPLEQGPLANALRARVSWPGPLARAIREPFPGAISGSHFREASLGAGRLL